MALAGLECFKFEDAIPEEERDDTRRSLLHRMSTLQNSLKAKMQSKNMPTFNDMDGVSEELSVVDDDVEMSSSSSQNSGSRKSATSSARQRRSRKKELKKAMTRMRTMKQTAVKQGTMVGGGGGLTNYQSKQMAKLKEEIT